MVKCPGCQHELKPSGELNVDGQTLSVYQCDTCTRNWHFDGNDFPVALTFAIDADGRCLDPETLEILKF